MAQVMRGPYYADIQVPVPVKVRHKRLSVNIHQWRTRRLPHHRHGSALRPAKRIPRQINLIYRIPRTNLQRAVPVHICQRIHVVRQDIRLPRVRRPKSHAIRPHRELQQTGILRGAEDIRSANQFRRPVVVDIRYTERIIRRNAAAVNPSVCPVIVETPQQSRLFQHEYLRLSVPVHVSYGDKLPLQVIVICEDRIFRTPRLPVKNIQVLPQLPARSAASTGNNLRFPVPVQVRHHRRRHAMNLHTRTRVHLPHLKRSRSRIRSSSGALDVPVGCKLQWSAQS